MTDQRLERVGRQVRAALSVPEVVVDPAALRWLLLELAVLLVVRRGAEADG